MEQQEYVSPSVELEPEESKSAFDRFAEVFTSPAEAFRGLPTAKKGPTIVWGLVITAIVAIFTVILVSTNETVREEIRAEQTAPLERQRDEGKISQEQYEQQMEAMEMFSSTPAFIVAGSIFGVIGSVIMALAVGTAVLMLSRMLADKGAQPVGFATALAATLISFMISNVESILTAIGMFVTSDFGFRISPSLLLDSKNDFLVYAVNLINPFTIWVWFALGTAIAIFANADRMKAMAGIAGIWIAVGFAMTAIGSLF